VKNSEALKSEKVRMLLNQIPLLLMKATSNASDKQPVKSEMVKKHSTIY